MSTLFHATNIAKLAPSKAGRDSFVVGAGLDWQSSYLAAEPACEGPGRAEQAAPEVSFL